MTPIKPIFGSFTAEVGRALHDGQVDEVSHGDSVKMSQTSSFYMPKLTKKITTMKKLDKLELIWFSYHHICKGHIAEIRVLYIYGGS